MARPGIEIRDRESISESFDLNPLVTAGWRAVTLVALAVVAFTALTGIVTYLLFFSDSNRGEIGVVRSLGLAHRQMIGLLALEHLLIAVVGMGLGTWSGLRMSSMMAPLVSLAESGGEVLPPIVVVIDWLTLSVFYIGVAATFATMLFIINRSVFRWDSDTASRLES
jgi:ABC-type lipoprotein release transport system permease subunit